MSKLTDELRQYLKIYNIPNFAFAGGGKVYIEYLPQDLGRGGHCAKYQVVGMGFNTDPKAAWCDHGNKVFNVFNVNGEQKAKCRNEALSWTSEKFGIELVKAPWRETWVSKQVYDTVMEKLAKAKAGSFIEDDEEQEP